MTLYIYNIVIILGQSLNVGEYASGNTNVPNAIAPNTGQKVVVANNAAR